MRLDSPRVSPPETLRARAAQWLDRLLWQAKEAKRERAEADALSAAVDKRRADELAKSRQNEKDAYAQAEREERWRARAVSAGRAVDGLQRTVQALDAAEQRRRAGEPGAGAGTDAIGLVDAAATARELLGACAVRYRDVGQEADRLASQVMGLQAYARVCQPELAGASP